MGREDYRDGFEGGSAQYTRFVDADGNVRTDQFDNIVGPAGSIMFWIQDQDSPYEPEHQLGRPEFKHIHFGVDNPDPLRFRTGVRAAQMFTNWRPHDGGWMWQYDVIPGSIVQASVYAHAWYSQCSQKPHHPPLEEDCETLIDWAHMYLAMGIDPTGGIDPYADTVVWGREYELYGGYGDPVESDRVEAQAGKVTVFFRSQATHPLKHCDVYIDDLTVSVYPDQQKRVDYEVTVRVPLPTHESLDTVLEDALEEWNSIIFSLHDARRLTSVICPSGETGLAILYGIKSRDRREEIIDFFGEMQPTARLEFIDPVEEHPWEHYLLAQGDPEWGDYVYAEGQCYTLRSQGCWITACAMAMRIFGIDPHVTPVDVDRIVGADGYTQCRMLWSAMPALGLEVLRSTTRRNDAVDHLTTGGVLFIEVLPTSLLHFVVGVEYDPHRQDFFVLDPWKNEAGWLKDLYEGAESYRLVDEYHKEPGPPEPPPPPSPPDPVQKRPLITPHLQTMIPGILEEYIGPMAQRGTPLPWVKIFNPGDAQALKDVSPETNILYRKWVPDQGEFFREVSPGVWEGDPQQLVDYYRPEMDEYGHLIDAIESLNEETATWNIPKLIAISYYDAGFCYVVRETWPHVRPAVAAAGVGNPDHGSETELMCSILGPALLDTHGVAVPHPYTPCRPEYVWDLVQSIHFGQRPPWSWNEMFRALGYHGIEFVLSETGPIGYYGPPSAPHLDAWLGWRADDCLQGDQHLMVDILFAEQDAYWAYNEYVGYEAIQAGTPFTSGIGIGWDLFLLWIEQWVLIRQRYEQIL